MGQCPECGSSKIKSQTRVSPSGSADPENPWSSVLQIIECGKCKANVPAHLWERWNDKSVKSAQAEWKKRFRPADPKRLQKAQLKKKTPKGPFLIDLTRKLVNEGDESLPFQIDLHPYKSECMFGNEGDVNFPFDPTVKPYHFSIVREGDKFFLHNLAPKMSTFVNGRHLNEGDARELQELDSIWFGEQNLIFTSVYGLDIKKLNRTVVFQNFKTKEVTDIWDYEETLLKNSKRIPQDFPPDVSLASFLSFHSSYSIVEIRYGLSTTHKPRRKRTSSLLRLEKKAIHLLQKGEYFEMLRVCDMGLILSKKTESEVCFHRLRGVAHGAMKIPKKARVDFLSALELDMKDAVTLANYITSCIDSGDPESALEGIRHFYSNLDGSAKGMVIDSILQAVKCKALALEDLPEDIILTIRAKLKRH